MRNLRFLDSFSIRAIRVVRTVVLPTPVPARTNAAPCSQSNRVKLHRTQLLHCCVKLRGHALRCRRLAKDYERSLESSLAWAQFRFMMHRKGRNMLIINNKMGFMNFRSYSQGSCVGVLQFRYQIDKRFWHLLRKFLIVSNS